MITLTTPLSLAGCGELADDQTTPSPLGTIHGRLTSRNPPTSKGRVAMAVFWDEKNYAAGLVAPIDVVVENPDPEKCKDLDTDKQYFDGTPWESRIVCKARQSHTSELAETVSYEPHFPVRFEIPVVNVPPRAARVNLGKFGGSGTFAMGSVMAFIDADRDREFDFGKVGKAPEEAIALSTGMPAGEDGSFVSNWVVYLDGEINLENVYEGYRDTLAAIPQGFSIWHTETKASNDPSEPPLRIREILPIEEPIELHGDPELKSSPLFCKKALYEIQYVAEPFEPEYGYSFCSEGGRDYEARKPNFAVEACRYKAEYIHRNITDLPESSIPADWPCPLD
jgi:hypothetical protein